MTRINAAFQPPMAELSADDREAVASLFRNETYFQPYRRVPEMQPLTGLERLAEMLMVSPDDLSNPSTPEEILAAFEHRRAL